MNEKHYSSDWAKEKSRDLVGKMMDETILTFRKPSQIKVLHFGGIDLTEARQVYLPRGILPQNIVSIEREKDIAESQQKLGTGIQVVHSTLKDYIASQKEIDFDVVSLDYIGPIAWEGLRLLRSLAYKQKPNHFVLHQANLIRRDHDSTNLYFIGEGMREREKNVNPFILEESSQKLKRLVNLEKELDSEDLDCERSKEIKTSAYSPLVRASIQGRHSQDYDLIFKFCAGKEYGALMSMLLEDFAKMGANVNASEKLPISKVCNLTNGRPDIIRRTEEYITSAVKFFVKQLPPTGVPLDELVFMLEDAIFTATKLEKNRKFFELRRMKNYSYISESGAPMIGDIYFLSHPFEVLNCANDFARTINFPYEFQCNDFHLFCRTLNKYNHQRRKFRSTEMLKNLIKADSERQFLGNSSKPVLTKKRFIEELESGKNVEDIQKQYRGWDNKPLAQWKAHFTMGTYTSKSMVEHNGDDSNLEKLSKEDAIDFLSSGIPPEEIQSAYPTSFSLGQLRAYKAHITMQTYKKDNISVPEMPTLKE